MIQRIFLTAVLLLGSLGFLSAESGKPVPVIFDTDMGNDVDDAFALAMLHSLIDRGECDLLAVTVTKSNPKAAEFVRMVNAWYGHGSIPVGLVENGVTTDDGRYTADTLHAAAENGFTYEAAPAEEAVTVLRRVLAAAEDGSVTIVQTGFSTNLARLLDSPADEISPLTGEELAAKKVKIAQVMAGIFGGNFSHKEYNIVTDVPAAQKFFSRWPTPVQVSGYEIGEAVSLPLASITGDYHYYGWHPITTAHENICMKWRGELCSWATFDLTCVLQGVRPDRGYFAMSEPGTVTVDDDGTTHFTPGPGGRHQYYFIPDAAGKARIQEALIYLCSQPPKRAE